MPDIIYVPELDTYMTGDEFNAYLAYVDYRYDEMLDNLFGF